MNREILHTPRHIHFIGIDGISMSALATIMQKRGWHVSGSDLKQSDLTRRLVRDGATFYLGHAKEHVLGAEVVVFTAAIRPDNPELVEARQSGATVLTRAEFLGTLMGEARYGIAISGSHGKTTTTALIGLLCEHAGLDPTVLIGGELDALGGNVKVGSSEYFVAEACEYVETFLALRPMLGVILNIDADHLDYFGDIYHIKAAFLRFAKLIPEHGLLVVCRDDANVREIMPLAKCPVVTYGLSQGADWWATQIELRPTGESVFNVYYRDESLGRVTLGVPGRHNILNALAGLAVGSHLHIPFATMAATLQSFRGTHRRFQTKGRFAGATIVDDYAHHPTEIRATLAAARALAPRRVIAVFQPHTYTRTKALLSEFAACFSDADEVIITDIYAAREQNTHGISSQHLVDKMKAERSSVHYIGALEDAAAFLSTRLQDGDLLLTMGAGDVHYVGEALLAMKQKEVKQKGRSLLLH